MTARRIIPCLVAALAVVMPALSVVSSAEAATDDSCARQVIDDWWDDDRVDDRIYALHCYREAIRILPVDIREYSNAEQDILRALAYAQQGRRDPGNQGPGAKPVSRPTQPETPSTAPPPAAAPVDTSGPSAIPIPLIVLGSIAGLLLVLGAAGHLKRRYARDRGGDPPSAA